MKKLTSFLLTLGLVLFAGCDKKTDSATGGKKLTIALLPKSKGNQYFVTCEKGARNAAGELGIDLLFDGPTNTDPAKQNEIVENWITPPPPAHPFPPSQNTGCPCFSAAAQW